MRDDPAEARPTGGAAALRCSSFTRSEDLDPVGSAGSYRGIVLAEIPLPWPRDITEHPALAGAAEALGAANMRLQGLVPDDRSDPHRRRLMAFTRPPGQFDRYRGRGWTAADSLLGEAVTAIAASGGDDAGAALAQPGA
ncbi:MAG: sucrase ferredoxin, partial [Candidatus Limnocylindrales bacterium]